MRTVNANGSRTAFGIAVFAGCLMMCAPVMATVAYTYENDNKTYVATVTDANTDMSSAAAAVLNGNSVTNFVLRGDYRLLVGSGMASSFTGDILIEGASTADQKNLLVLGSSNAMGIDHGPGTITLQHGGLVPAHNTIIAKDVAFGLNHSDWGGRMLQVWEARSVKVNGKITTGNRNADIIGYRNSNLTIAGGLEGNAGYAYFALYGGASVKIEDHPVNIKNGFYFRYTDASSNYDSNGFQGYVDFAVAGNSMGAVGWDTGTSSYRLRRYKIKTTADWAFNKSNMKVFVAYDGMWDLCGTSQRVGQFDVRMPDGANASVITNSSETPATLYLGQIYNYSNTSLPADIRFGGNLSAVFEGNIYTTKVDHVMTAAGNLTVLGNGNYFSRLEFLENGSWPNATNVTVSGNGKITIANPNALGRRANVNLKANSSLEIASGVTVCVKTLTVNGELQHRGDYTFGSGTLRVSHPCGFQLRVR